MMQTITKYKDYTLETTSVATDVRSPDGRYIATKVDLRTAMRAIRSDRAYTGSGARLYQCRSCEFRAPVDWIGATLMQQHLLSEHDVALVTEFRNCLGCGTSVLVRLGEPAPTHCQLHSGLSHG